MSSAYERRPDQINIFCHPILGWRPVGCETLVHVHDFKLLVTDRPTKSNVRTETPSRFGRLRQFNTADRLAFSIQCDVTNVKRLHTSSPPLAGRDKPTMCRRHVRRIIISCLYGGDTSNTTLFGRNPPLLAVPPTPPHFPLGALLLH